MIQYHFKCTLLSDVIISSASATEGFHPSLDYIPGAKFWGIVASSLYEKQTAVENLNFFHNGKVYFGDAHMDINGIRSHKIPLSWFRNKHKPNERIYVHHTVQDYQSLTEGGVQPEQLSDDYFNEKGEYANPGQDFSIKSAYNSQLRRSEDEKMFGYYALPAGSKWRFIVSSRSKELLEKTKDALKGKKRIGRSRSAQYGLADIVFETETEPKAQQLDPGTHYLYADSAIILPLDVPLKDALQGATIDFGKSKIRTRIYQSWNTYRDTRDADRQIIEKGSVIVIYVSKDISEDILLKHLMERRAEGFGEFLINPSFLTNIVDNHFSGLPRSEWKDGKVKLGSTYAKNGAKDDVLLAVLNKRLKAHNQVHDIDEAVNLFVNNETNKKLFRSVTASQWGTVRSFAKLNFDMEKLKFELFSDGANGTRKGYLVSGIAEEKWRAGKGIIEEIINNGGKYPEPRQLFLEKLAAEMSKRKRDKEN